MVVIMRDDAKTGSNHNSDQPKDFQVEVSLKVQENLLKKKFTFDIDDKIWYAKLQVINELAKGVKDVFNYGFYEPPCNGRSGKFMDEERTFRDYPQRKSPTELEFKYKRRVYKSLQYDGKTLQKVHTKSNLKKLLECVTSNSVSLVSKWTEKGLDPNFQDEKTGETPLTIAVNGENRGDLIVALVNGGAHLDYRSGDGLTPMHKAAVFGKPRSIKILLDLGNSPNMKDPKGFTPLYYTVLHGGDSYCCQLLLDEHAEFGLTDHQGMQEIHHACKKGLVQHLEHLIFYGADIDATTASGNTPLHITALSNQEECARVLLFRGAKRNVLNFANQSAYEVAAVAGNKDLAEFIRTFTDGQIVKISEKPTYSTRRRKTAQKPKASSLFTRSSSDASTKSDSSPRSSSGSLRSSTDTISLEENGLINKRVQRSMSLCSTTSDSSYCSESETLEPSVNEHRTLAKKNRSRDVDQPSGKMAPPVKIVSGAATIRKRLYANAPGRRYIAVRDYIPCMGGELEVERGDIVEVFYVGEKGFWEGRIDNRTGWFPSACVEELKKGEKGRPKTLFGRPSSLSSMFNKSEAQGPIAHLPDDRYIQPARTVILNRGKKGFGFQMRGANCQTPRLNFKPTKEFPALQYIGEVEPRGEADSKGVKSNDFILEVNDEDVATATHSHVVNLIKRSGKAVKLKIVTVPLNGLNGVDSIDSGYNSLAYNSLRVNSRVPPPLPQRDPSTTLTLGRMRTNSAHSRPSLFEAGLAYSYEEPASFQVDSVIAVSKDSPWSTLQRRKPGTTNSRSAAQFKFNGATKPKPHNTNLPISSAQRSKSMQNIASLPPSYDVMTGKRPVSTAVPFQIPQVPDRYSRSVSQDAGSLSRRLELHSNSDPNLRAQTLSRSKSLNDPRDQINYTVDSSRDQINYTLDSSTTNFGSEDILSQETTIVATPVSASVVSVEESGPSAKVTPVCDSNNNGNQNGGTYTRERKHSLESKTSEPFNLSNALQKAVEARNERMNEQASGNPLEWNANNRKESAPSMGNRKRANTTEKFRSNIMSQINKTELGTEECEPYASHSHSNTSSPEKNSYSSIARSKSNEAIALRPGLNRQKSSERPKSALEIRTSKPALVPKPVTQPPPPPVPPMVLPPKHVKPAKPAKQVKGKKPDVPLTAVRQGLITVDALQAKKGKLKAVKATDSETPKSSKSIHDLVGKLAGQGGKPTAMFGGNQHSNMLAKAVAARAARLATEARDSEQSESPSSWEDESPSPNIPFKVNPPRQRLGTPKKTPPPVPPKKRSPTTGNRPIYPRPEIDSPTRRKLYPPNINDYSPDRPSLFSTEEDRTMMMFDDILRMEVESENWSLSSWNSSDSSTAADIIAPPSFPGNGYDDMQRKSSTGSSTRPWYEYSSGSPSEDSLNASTERISLVKPSLSQELKGTTDFEDEKVFDERKRSFSNGSEKSGQVKTSCGTNDIQLNPIEQASSLPNLNLEKDASVENINSNSNKNIVNYESTYQSDRQHESEKTVKDNSDNALPTGTSISDDTETEDGLVEQTFTTSTGVKIKLRLQPNRKPQSPQVEPPPTPQPQSLETNNIETPNQEISPDEVTTPNFIPPPPIDFDDQAFDELPSPPLPPPPEFGPTDDNSEVFSPLPAPPMDFCDSDVDHDAPLGFDQTNSGGFKDKPLLEWSCNDVCDWLESLNLSQYKDTFKENDIQGVHLPELTKVELQELGIKSLGHRMTMENSVAKLCHPMESNC